MAAGRIAPRLNELPHFALFGAGQLAPRSHFIERSQTAFAQACVGVDHTNGHAR